MHLSVFLLRYTNPQQSFKQLLLGTQIASLSLHSPLSDDFSHLQITTGGSLDQIKSLTDTVLTEVTSILLTPYSFVLHPKFFQLLKFNTKFKISLFLGISQYGRIFSCCSIHSNLSIEQILSIYASYYVIATH